MHCSIGILEVYDKSSSPFHEDYQATTAKK